MIRRLYLSDLHLDDVHHAHFATFKHCLRQASGSVDEIIILGDLTEMWIGDDDDDALAVALKTCLAQTTRTCPVRLMHGNRDFLIGERFASDTGVELIDDPTLTEDGLLLCHGDALCTDDTAYQALRATLRSAQWRQDILAKSLTERRAIGKAMRAQSRASSANKPANITDVNPDAVNDLASRYSARTLIHGHTHRPGVHEQAWGSRYVLGAWERCGWRLMQNGDEFSLECFALITA